MIDRIITLVYFAKPSSMVKNTGITSFFIFIRLLILPNSGLTVDIHLKYHHIHEFQEHRELAELPTV